MKTVQWNVEVMHILENHLTPNEVAMVTK